MLARLLVWLVLIVPACVVDESISGIVVDDTGAPIRSFEISATVSVPGLEISSDKIQASGKFDDPAGRFRLTGVKSDWVRLLVKAEHHAPATVDGVDVPGAEGALRIVLARNASLTGSVVDPTGKPVAGARVFAYAYWGDSHAAARNCVTDAEGRFQLSDVPPGPVRVQAVHDAWADCAALDLDVAAGSSVADLRLTTRVGGTLTGEVVDEKGKAIADCAVEVGGVVMPMGRRLVTDATGRFTTSRLAPGAYAVSVHVFPPGDGTWKRGSATVAVRDGEATHVKLGGAPPPRVRIQGTITSAAKPMSGVVVAARAEDGAGTKATSDARGHYELAIEAPGEVTLTLISRQAAGARPRTVSVAGKQELTENFDLPVRRVSGRVVGPNGKGAGGLVLALFDPKSPPDVTVVLPNTVTSDPDGKFVFEHVEAGTHGIRFTPFPNLEPSMATPFAPAIRDDIVVASNRDTDGVALQLKTAGGMTGVARGPHGVFAPFATVETRDEAGRIVLGLGDDTTDGQGRFHFIALPPGRIRVQARTDRLVSGVITVEVKSGATTKTELTLVPGTTLHVFVQDAAGVATGASVSVRDEDGNEFGRHTKSDNEYLRALHPIQGMLISPLAPGRYTVTASDSSGRSASTTLSIGDEKDARVELKLSK